MVANDDFPHPVPPAAYLRYKENWFFLVFDKDNDIFSAIHVVSEPGFERIRFACHLSVQGEIHSYSNEVSFPNDFAFSPKLGDGKMEVQFVKSHEHIILRLNNDDVDMEINFIDRAPLFNFDDYDSANPDKVPLKEVMQVASNQQHLHQQQGMFTKGSLRMKKGRASGIAFVVDALGYRDHSRSIRSDNLVSKHFWTGLHFTDHVFGVMSVTSIFRPESPTNCGYVYDKSKGLRSLRDVEIIGNGDGPANMPANVEFRLSDIYGEKFTLHADISKRYAHVPLQSEKPGAMPYVYRITENFAPLRYEERNDTGVGLVEIGWSESVK